MEPSDKHVASLPARARALLARAQHEEGWRRSATLAVVSQMLQEQLAAVDRRLRADFARDPGTDHLVAGDAAAPVDALAALVDLAEHLDRDTRGPGDGP